MPEFREWLKQSSIDSGKAYCKWCNSELRAHVSDLKTHITRNRHAKIQEDKNRQKSAASMFKPIEVKITEEMKVNRRELRLALFIACKASIRSMDDLGEIIQQEFPNSIQMHRTKCSALIRKVLGPYFMAELKNDLKDSIFSLMVDESTDVSTTKLFACSVRYYSERFKTIKETFMCLNEVTYCDAHTLMDELAATVHLWGLDPNKFFGIGTDGAPNVAGCNTSLQTLARKKYPSLTHIKCTAHTLDLAAKDAMTKLPCNLEYMIRESYNWFAHSSIRQSEYKKVLDLVGFDSVSVHNMDEEASIDGRSENAENTKKPLKLISLSTTRWLVIADCLQRILSQFDALKAMFEMANVKNKDYTTRLLSEMFKDENNRIYLHFLNPLLQDLRRLTKLFQEKSCNSLDIYKELEDYFMGLARRILKPEIIRQNQNSSIKLCSLSITDFVLLNLDDIDYGQVFLRGIRDKDVGTKNAMKVRCCDFMVELFKGLQNRFEKTLETVKGLIPFTLPSFMDEAPKLHHYKRPFFEADPVSLDRYENLRRFVRPLMEDTDTTESFWLRIHNMKVGNEFKYRFLSEGVIKMMCLPLSNAEVERTFSATSHVKWWRRAQMKTDLLQSCMHIVFGLKWMDKSIKDWIPPVELLKYDKKLLYDKES